MAPIVIIGSGMAAYALARELRKLNQSALLLLMTQDDGAYYSKPNLSNALVGNKTAQGLVISDAAQQASTLHCEIRAHTHVQAIDRVRKELHTSQGVQAYSQLVLAVGADPIRLPLEGNAVDAVLSVNSLTDYAAFRTHLAHVSKPNPAKPETSVHQIAAGNTNLLTTAKNRARVLILGAGLIGCEFANDLCQAGYAVTVIDPSPQPLSALLPAQAGVLVQAHFQQAGIVMRMGRAAKAVNAIPPTHGANASASDAQYQITLDNDELVAADIVLSAVGLRARTNLASQANLVCKRGIVVDTFLRTNDENIFALGDCAEQEGQVRPYVQPLLVGAKALAQTLLGNNTAVKYPPMPVVIKTPIHPVVVQAPLRVQPSAASSVTDWVDISHQDGVWLEQHDAQGLQGFVLTGKHIQQRMSLLQKMRTS